MFGVYFWSPSGALNIHQNCFIIETCIFRYWEKFGVYLIVWPLVALLGAGAGCWGGGLALEMGCGGSGGGASV